MDPNIISLIENMYDNVECTVVTNGQLTEWMGQSGNRSETGLLAITYPVQFVLLEFVIADLKSLCKEFKLDTNLSFGTRYADNTTLMSTVLEKLQISNKNVKLPVGNGV